MHLLDGQGHEDEGPGEPVVEVVGQLGAGKGEEHQHEAEPDEREAAQVAAPGRGYPGHGLEQHGGEGQHGQGGHHQVVEPAAAVALHGIAEAVDVVLEEEAVDEVLALGQVLGGVPGEVDGQKQRDPAGVEHGPQPGPPLALRGVEEKAHRQRDDYRHRPLGEKAQADGGEGGVDPALPALAPVEEDGEEAGGEKEVEHGIGGGGLADDADLHAEGEHDGAEKAGALVGHPAQEGEGEQNPGGGRQRRGQAQGELVETEQRDRRGLQPVDQHRLVEARLAVEPGRDQVAARQHFPRGLGEGALVEVEKRDVAQVDEKGGEHGQPEQQRTVERLRVDQGHDSSGYGRRRPGGPPGGSHYTRVFGVGLPAARAVVDVAGSPVRWRIIAAMH